MDILSLLIIATGLSMDSFAVCIGKGMCRKRFNTWRAFRIALVFALFQGLMPLTGYALSVGFAQWIQQFDHWLAFIILAVIGLKMIREDFLPKKEADCVNCDCNETEVIDWRKVISLALATSIDAAATGLIFASYPGTIAGAIVIIGVVCFIFSMIGMSLGVRLGKRIHFRIEMGGGIILIAIGLKILLEHLFIAA